MSNKRLILIALAAVVAVAAAAGYWFLGRKAPLPGPGSEVYEQATRAFYRGLASLDVGLLEDAKREFAEVTARVPEEPAGWANLGLAHLRQGELDAAAEPIERALMLMPDNASLELLAGRMEISRGQIEAGLAHLRRAAMIAPNDPLPRFALAEEIERAALPDGDKQALALMDELAKLAPENVAVIVERARIAARVQDRQRLNEAVERLKPAAANWPPVAAEQYQALQQAVASGDMQAMPLTTAQLRNVLSRVPSFVEDLGAIRTPTELISEPIDRFLALTPPSSTPAPRDLRISFATEPVGEPLKTRVVTLAAIPPDGDEAPRIVAVEFDSVSVVNEPGVRLPFPSRLDNRAPPDAQGVAIADINNDFRRDIIVAGTGGIRLFIQQADRRFVDRTPKDETAAGCVCRGIWPADIEMDGDLDLVAAPHVGQPFVLRNNGNGSWTSDTSLFQGLSDVTQFAWADLDRDGDPDAAFLGSIFNGSARIEVYANRQAGDFVRLPEASVIPVAFTVADIDSDGSFDIVALERTGVLRGASLSGGKWTVRDLGSWPTAEPMISASRLVAADFDNNGAIDLLASGTEATHLWLGDTGGRLILLDELMAGNIFPVGDLNKDGRLDLAAIAPVRLFGVPFSVQQLVNKGTTNYHWKEIRPRAQETAGDQRINSFGVGGYVEVRAGPLFQKQMLTGGPVHVGLGTQTDIDVARIVWPNGVPQAEFGVKVDGVLVAEQRLKGSCPWVFAWDGSRMVFVTDFLWRSPLGLRINAQDTAGVTQTEDWVRLRGDQLVPRDGLYDVRITAELWETHFFDHVSLLAVDHSDDTEVFVDERFSAASPPALKVHAVSGMRAVKRAWDHRGTDVTGTVAKGDGQYLATFSRGRYQGIAEDHFVEIELDDAGADVLLASGWIYPTDSSINVAIAQAGITPRGLSLEARNPDGTWRVVNGDLGFPAGKNKTLVIDLNGAKGAQRLRLRTNLEIYWDSLMLGRRADSPVRTTQIAASGADLRYRGFSQTVSTRGDVPETPAYDRVASTSPRWRDLTGYHTRFGDVRELIERVDDRYVIMNAGDEMRIQFKEAPAVAQGWRRDFVLIGDGWEKDGDYNTGFSQTVLPLPSHDKPAYGSGTTSLALEDDPVYRRYPGDWQQYHTRYVTPERFLNALTPAKRN